MNAKVLLLAGLVLSWVAGACGGDGPSSSKGTIAYLGAEDGEASAIFLVRPDGGGRRSVSGDGEAGDCPAWSPDGTKLAFFDSEHRIHVVNVAEGTGQVVSANADDYLGPVWSPDGTKLAFGHYADDNSDSSLYVMDAGGSNRRRLAPELKSGAVPAWSPDGREILVSGTDAGGRWDLYAVAADGSGMRRLTNDAAVEGDASWSPDGAQIAYAAGDGQTGDIFVINRDGSGGRRLTNDPEADIGAAWSPDGRHIGYVKVGRDRTVVFVRELASGADRALTELRGNQGPMYWSPDGEAIAFISSQGQEAPAELYTIGLDGKGLKRIGEIWGPCAAWSPK